MNKPTTRDFLEQMAPLCSRSW